MAKLDHPHIVKVLGEPSMEDGWAYFVMECLDGGDFRRAVLDGRLDWKQRLNVIESIARALDDSHSRNIIHRDLKPANILLNSNLDPKLTDFDLVLADDTTGLTRTRAGMGSYHYAAPESMDNAAGASASCDIYSLVATVIFALRGKELTSHFLIDREKFLAKLDLPKEALDLVLQGLHLEPELRPTSASRWIQDFRSLLDPGSSFEGPLISEQVAQKQLFEVLSLPERDIPLWCEIPIGEAWIGSPESEQGRYIDEGPQYLVEFTQPFWIGASPVTNAPFAVFVDSKADLSQPDHPVVGVSWNDAMRFYKWLALEQGLQGARLPTEEEWEFACRAGSTTRYWNGDGRRALDEIGWYDENSGGLVHRVAEKLANAWGLFDVHGNVWEWTAVFGMEIMGAVRMVTGSPLSSFPKT